MKTKHDTTSGNVTPSEIVYLIGAKLATCIASAELERTNDPEEMLHISFTREEVDSWFGELNEQIWNDLAVQTDIVALANCLYTMKQMELGKKVDCYLWVFVNLTSDSIDIASQRNTITLQK